MTTIYTIVPVSFEYNDEYNYPAGNKLPIKAYKDEDNAKAALKELEEKAASKAEPEMYEGDKLPAFYKIAKVEVEDEAVSYQSFRAEAEAAKAKVLAAAKEYFASESKKVFDANPDLLAFRLRNYTPYFNDGEPCEFGVGEPYIMMSQEGVDQDEEAGDYEDGFENYWSQKETPPATWKAFKDVEKLIRSIDEDSFKDMFGDHVCITSHRNGKVETEEYDHD